MAHMSELERIVTQLPVTYLRPGMVIIDNDFPTDNDTIQSIKIDRTHVTIYLAPDKSLKMLSWVYGLTDSLPIYFVNLSLRSRDESTRKYHEDQRNFQTALNFIGIDPYDTDRRGTLIRAIATMERNGNTDGRLYKAAIQWLARLDARESE